MKFIFLLLVMMLPAAGQFKNPFPGMAKAVMGKDGGNRFFYYPTKKGPHTPKDYGHRYEEVIFSSQDGTELHGWFMKPKQKKPKGTVVFSHGNAGAVGYHVGFVSFMVKGGYQVLLYDYRGYGKSKGKVSRKGLVEDVTAAFDYLVTRADVNQSRLFSFGHSLGGAKSIAALGMKRPKGLRGVISFAGFSSYQKMAELVAGEFGKSVVDDVFAPEGLIEKIHPVPVLIVHGVDDKVVPVSHAKTLYRVAKKPKTLFEVEKGTHNGALWTNKQEYSRKILAWMDQRLKSPLPKTK